MAEDVRQNLEGEMGESQLYLNLATLGSNWKPQRKIYDRKNIVHYLLIYREATLALRFPRNREGQNQYMVSSGIEEVGWFGKE